MTPPVDSWGQRVVPTGVRGRGVGAGAKAGRASGRVGPQTGSTAAGAGPNLMGMAASRFAPGWPVTGAGT